MKLTRGRPYIISSMMILIALFPVRIVCAEEEEHLKAPFSSALFEYICVCDEETEQ